MNKCRRWEWGKKLETLQISLELGTGSKGNMVNYVVWWQLCNEDYGPMTKIKK